ncbi:MAG: class I SAM-dependent methyltransferase [Maribacter sp.]|jgi:ubiquinone/menaquinone biosynthesis C-methylase UbiE
MKKNSITQATYNKVAQKYWEKASSFDQYNASYDAFCAVLPPNAEVFEMGCGPGNVIQYVLNKRPDLHYTASDFAPNMLALAKKHNSNVHFLELDCRAIDRLAHKFDAIIGAFVLPYLNKAACAKLISDCAKLLSPKGLLYLSTMEGDDDQSGFENTSFSDGDLIYIHYHQEHYIRECLTQNGYEVLHFIKQACHEPDGRVYNDMIFMARRA